MVVCPMPILTARPLDLRKSVSCVIKAILCKEVYVELLMFCVNNMVLMECVWFVLMATPCEMEYAY